jgi:hypothetical protein
MKTLTIVITICIYQNIIYGSNVTSNSQHSVNTKSLDEGLELTPRPSLLKGNGQNKAVTSDGGHEMSSDPILYDNVTIDARETVTPPFTPVYVLDLLSKFYIVIGVVGVIANGLTVAIMAFSKKIHANFTNWFIINQSVLDFWSAIFMLVSIPADRTIFINLSGVWGDILCKLWLGKVFMWSLFVSSTYNLLVLTFERYCKVVHPIFHRNNFGRKQSIVFTVFVWLFGFGYNFAYKIPPASLIGGRCVLFQYPNKVTSVSVGFFTLFVQYFFPLIAMIYLYGRMAQKLKSRVVAAPVVINQIDQPQNQQQQKPAGSKVTSQTDKFRKNTIKTLAIVAGTFVLCWSWNQWLYLVYNFGYKIDFSGGFNGFTAIAMFLNCCVNPIIYALKYR